MPECPNSFAKSLANLSAARKRAQSNLRSKDYCFTSESIAPPELSQTALRYLRESVSTVIVRETHLLKVEFLSEEKWFGFVL